MNTLQSKQTEFCYLFWSNLEYLANSNNKELKDYVKILLNRNDMTNNEYSRYMNITIKNKSIPNLKSIVRLLNYEKSIKYEDLYNYSYYLYNNYIVSNFLQSKFDKFRN